MLWTLTFMVFGHLKLLSVSSQTLTSASDSIPDSNTEFQGSDRVTTDAGYVYSAGIGSHKIHSTAATWNEAWWICRQELGHLAIINSPAESQAIAQLFLESYPHFGSLNSSQALIGFHDRFREGQYVTIHDESLAEAGFDDWFPDQPDNALGGENCGAIVDNGQLNDVNCNEPYAFVCERPYFEEESGGTISSESSESLSPGESYEDFGPILIFDSYNETEFNATSEASRSIAATASSGSDTPQSSSLSTTGFDSSGTTVLYESETTESPDSDTTLFGIDSTFSTFEEDVCLLPALLGQCYNYTQRWYYDSYESRCKQFYYGGCGGNENNFATEHDCAYRCQPLSSTTPPENQEFRVVSESCFLGISSHPLIPPVVPVTDPSPEIVPGPNRDTVPVKVNLSAVDGPFAEGSEFSIACNVDGFPPPRIEWFKDDYPIQTNNRITISAANILTITNADKSDSGKYRCQAANRLTSDADTVEIKVAGIFIHPNCQDNPFFAKCDLIVGGKYCHHQYYAKFCCRSCTEAGQLPAGGSHINETRRKRRSILSFL